MSPLLLNTTRYIVLYEVEIWNAAMLGSRGFYFLFDMEGFAYFLVYQFVNSKRVERRVPLRGSSGAHRGYSSTRFLRWRIFLNGVIY